ncbi:ABC transporter permease subunit [Aestuariispira insulae]
MGKDAPLQSRGGLRQLGNRLQSQWKRLVIALPYLWLFIFFLVPFAIILKISLAEAIIARPPFTDLLEWTEGEFLPSIYVTLENFQYLLEDDLYWLSYLNSLKLATISTLLCLLVGYPMAYGIARSSQTMKNILLLLVILPFWTSFLLRVYAWMGILNTHGLLNNMLEVAWNIGMALGLTDAPFEPLQIMYTETALYIGIIYSYLPFMILPLYANLEKMDFQLHEAAQDLGSKPATVFLTVTLPLSMPGIIAGSLLVFIPATGEYVIPALLGEPDTLMIGRVLFDEFFVNRDWPVASSVAIALLVFLVVPMMVYQHFQSKAEVM